MGLPGHEELINAVKFTPNGRLVASASDDRTVCAIASMEGGVMITCGKFHVGKEDSKKGRNVGKTEVFGIMLNHEGGGVYSL